MRKILKFRKKSNLSDNKRIALLIKHAKSEKKIEKFLFETNPSIMLFLYESFGIMTVGSFIRFSKSPSNSGKFVKMAFRRKQKMLLNFFLSIETGRKAAIVLNHLGIYRTLLAIEAGTKTAVREKKPEFVGVRNQLNELMRKRLRKSSTDWKEFFRVASFSIQPRLKKR